MDTKTSIFKALIDAMCCIMCADGKITKAEKQAIHKVMLKLKSPLQPEQINEHIITFVDRVGKCGFSSVLQESSEQIYVFKRLGKESLLFKCLDFITAADGIKDKREIEVARMFRGALEIDSFLQEVMSPKRTPERGVSECSNETSLIKEKVRQKKEQNTALISRQRTTSFVKSPSKTENSIPKSDRTPYLELEQRIMFVLGLVLTAGCLCFIIAIIWHSLLDREYSSFSETLIFVIIVLGFAIYGVIFSVWAKSNLYEKEASKSKLGLIIKCSIIVFLYSLPWIFSFMFFCFGDSEFAQGIREFNKHRREYLELNNLRTMTRYSDQQPYIRGKVVVFDVKRKIVDRKFQHALSDSLRACDPNEVGTVIWVEHGIDNVGRYVSSRDPSVGQGAATQCYCNVEVIDIKNLTVVFSKTIFGPPPPDVLKGYTYRPAKPSYKNLIGHIEQFDRYSLTDILPAKFGQK